MKLHQIFFAILVACIPVQLGFHTWPAWASVLGRRIDYLSPTLYLTDVLIVITLLSWMFQSFPRRRESIFASLKNVMDPSLRWGDKKVTAIVLLSLVIVGINIFFSSSPSVSIYHWLKVLEFLLLGVYIVKTKPSLGVVQNALMIAVFYSSLIALFQYISQHSIGGPFWFLGERTFSSQTPGIALFNVCHISGIKCEEVLRAYGTFPHPNVLAGFLVATLPLIIFNFQFLIFNQTKKFLMLKIFTVLLAVVTLVFTFSRSAILVGLLMTIISLPRVTAGLTRNLFIKYWIPAFAGMTLVMFSFLLFSKTEESVVVREQLNQAAIHMVFESPLFGVGLGNFLVELPKMLVSRQVYFLQPVHNIYLLVLSETGVVGLSLFLWVLWKALRKFSIKQNFFQMSLLVLLLLGFVDHYVLTIQQGQLLFTIFLSLGLSQDHLASKA